MFYVYRFLDAEDNVIYVGKSKQDLQQRFRGHRHLPDECYAMVRKIEYTECPTATDMSIKEIYYINKYQSGEVFFNRLDVEEPSQSFELVDNWKMYEGFLPDHFCNSINIEEISSIEGSIVNEGHSASSALNKKDIDKIVRYMTYVISESDNENQRQIRFRNLVMFVTGINLPLKVNQFSKLKYKDVFDGDDEPIPIAVTLNRTYKDEIIKVPLRENVARLLKLYRKFCNFTYDENFNDYLFASRVGSNAITINSIWRIVKDAADAMLIKSDVGGESMRKTYFLGVYEAAENKTEALVFAERLMGASRYTNLVKYLGLPESIVDMDYYFGDKFSLGAVDFDKVESAFAAPKRRNVRKMAVRLGDCKGSKAKLEEAKNEQRLSLANAYILNRRYLDALKSLDDVTSDSVNCKALRDSALSGRAVELMQSGDIGGAIEWIGRIEKKTKEIVRIESEVNAFIAKYGKWLGKWCPPYAKKKMCGEWLFDENRYSLWMHASYDSELRLVLERREASKSMGVVYTLRTEARGVLIFAQSEADVENAYIVSYVKDGLVQGKANGKSTPSLLYKASDQWF